jgi:benzoate/toluate 1,2-dioxygenase reductase component
VERLAAMGPFSSRLIARRWLVPGILELRMSRPAGLAFLPGQFLRFVMDGYERDYTMVSAPDDASLEFCIAMVDQGRFSTDILTAKIGTSFELSGPHGHFIFQGPVNPAVFVATGTGIAPFVSFCRAGIRDALLLHGAQSPDGLIYRDLLQTCYQRYIPCISDPAKRDAGPANAFTGRVTHFLSDVLDPGIYDFYLCGRRSMVQDATAIVDERFDGSRLFIEVYD